LPLRTAILAEWLWPAMGRSSERNEYIVLALYYFAEALALSIGLRLRQCFLAPSPSRRIRSANSGDLPRNHKEEVGLIVKRGWAEHGHTLCLPTCGAKASRQLINVRQPSQPTKLTNHGAFGSASVGFSRFRMMPQLMP